MNSRCSTRVNSGVGGRTSSLAPNSLSLRTTSRRRVPSYSLRPHCCRPCRQASSVPDRVRLLSSWMSAAYSNSRSGVSSLGSGSGGGPTGKRSEVRASDRRRGLCLVLGQSRLSTRESTDRCGRDRCGSTISRWTRFGNRCSLPRTAVGTSASAEWDAPNGRSTSARTADRSSSEAASRRSLVARRGTLDLAGDDRSRDVLERSRRR